MTKKEAFEIVLNELKEVPLFVGQYDAKNGNEHYMHGISTVMEFIAYSISDEVGEQFDNEFGKNFLKSHERALTRP